MIPEKVDICPACAAEFEPGTFKACGGGIIREVEALRKALGVAKEKLVHIALYNTPQNTQVAENALTEISLILGGT